MDQMAMKATATGHRNAEALVRRWERDGYHVSGFRSRGLRWYDMLSFGAGDSTGYFAIPAVAIAAVAVLLRRVFGKRTKVYEFEFELGRPAEPFSLPGVDPPLLRS